MVGNPAKIFYMYCLKLYLRASSSGLLSGSFELCSSHQIGQIYNFRIRAIQNLLYSELDLKKDQDVACRCQLLSRKNSLRIC